MFSISNFKLEHCWDDYRFIYFRIITDTFRSSFTGVPLYFEDLFKIQSFFNEFQNNSVRTFSWADLSFSYTDNYLTIFYKENKFVYEMSREKSSEIAESVKTFIEKYY
jgi:hypothetical protein